MNYPVKDSANKQVKEIQLDASKFAADFREPLVHQAVVTYMSNGRQGSVAQKTRSEVSGGGKKPMASKRNGQARAGTIRSPLWRKGGVIFAAKPRDYTAKLNKKMYRCALRSILSEIVRQERLVILDNLNTDFTKTRQFIDNIKPFDYQTNLRYLFLFESPVASFERVTRNIRNIEVNYIQALSLPSLVQSDVVLLPKLL